MFQVLATPEPLTVVSAATAVRELSREFGQPIEISKGLREQPVMVVPRGASPRKILDGLALALHASLTFEGKAIRLSRTPSDLRKLKALDRSKMLRAIHDRIALWDKEIVKAASLGSTGAQVAHYIHLDAMAFANRRPGDSLHRDVDPVLLSPAGRMLRKVVGAIDSVEFANLEPGDVKVFSSVPTSVELPIPNSEQLLDEFSGAERAYSEDKNLVISAADKRYLRYSYPLPDPGMNLEGLKSILSVNRFQDVLYFHLGIFNGEGKPVAHSSNWTVLSRDNSDRPGQAKLIADQFKNSVINLEGESLQFATGVWGQSQGIKRGEAIWNHLLHPELFDPANFLVVPGIRPIISSDPRPTIVVVPDPLYEDAKYCTNHGQLNVTAFEKLLVQNLASEEHAGVRVIRPIDPLSTEPYTSSREAMGRMLRKFWRSDCVNLQDWSKLAAMEGQAFPYFPQNLTILAVLGGLPLFRDESVMPSVFHVLGNVSDEEWNDLSNHSTISVSSDAVRSALWNYLLTGPTGAGQALKLPPIYDNVTELCPNGLPAEAHITLHRQMRLSLGPIADKERSGAWDLDVLQWTQAAFGKIRSLPPSAQSSLGSSVNVLTVLNTRVDLVPCTYEAIQVDFVLPMGTIFSQEFHNPGREVGPACKYADLPVEYKKAIEEEWRRLESKGKS